MAMGKRETERQGELFVTYERLPRSPGHVFYDTLNGLLRDAGFDAYVDTRRWDISPPHSSSRPHNPNPAPTIRG